MPHTRLSQITTSGSAWQLLARQLIGLRFAATLCLRVSSALLWPCPKHTNPPHGGPRAILQLQSLRWSTIAAATMSRSESARGGLLRSVEPAGSRQLRDFPDMRCSLQPVISEYHQAWSAAIPSHTRARVK